MTRNLAKDEEYTELELSSEFFLKHGTGTTGTNFTRMPGNTPCNPVVNEMISTATQTITLIETVYVIDNNLNAYYKIVGGRPHGTRRK